MRSCTCRAETWRPDSFYDRIAANKKLGLHTLCLLDIKVSAFVWVGGEERDPGTCANVV